MGIPKGRSGLENDLIDWLLEQSVIFSYEGLSFQYTVPETVHSYTPDFEVLGKIVELKGRLTSIDRRKILLALAGNENSLRRKFLMVFSRPNNKISKGSKTTYADWCEKNEIEWLHIKEFKQRILKGKL